MLTEALILLGLALLALTLTDAVVQRLPLSPALIYLAVGWAAGALVLDPFPRLVGSVAPSLAVAVELAVLVSLFAVGLRLRVPPTLRAWRVALLMAGPGMVIAIVLAALASQWLLGLPWGAALLLGAMMAPTDPVLASEVQIRSDNDRDAVRLSITAEAGLNDGSAMPAVMLALGLMGLHPLGSHGANWWWADLILPLGGGAVLGIALGLLLGHALKLRLERGEPLARDELLYAGAVTLAYGLARATDTSAFIAVFATGVTLLWPLPETSAPGGSSELGQRLYAFGARCERLVEAAMVLAVGVALHRVEPSWGAFAFALVLVFVVRPLSVYAVVRLPMMAPSQRRLMAWFGIRGIGTLFYLAYALEHGVTGALADELMAAALIGIAVSIVLHGVSATPLMNRYQRRRRSVANRLKEP